MDKPDDPSKNDHLKEFSVNIRKGKILFLQWCCGSVKCIWSKRWRNWDYEELKYHDFFLLIRNERNLQLFWLCKILFFQERTVPWKNTAINLQDERCQFSKSKLFVPDSLEDLRYLISFIEIQKNREPRTEEIKKKIMLNWHQR